METYFYSHLVPIDETLDQLKRFEIDEKERQELEMLIISMYHHRVLDIVLLAVPVQHHEQIVRHFSHSPHDLEIMSFIKQFDPDVDLHIQETGKQLHTELVALFAEVAYERNKHTKE